ncbi:hypothetical protein BGX38DRAFT_1261528 [Terfezia claveryi]|nr:hypothetical protein BGX38DRAFT_1261528 [Terfezia claveryi]
MTTPEHPTLSTPPTTTPTPTTEPEPSKKIEFWRALFESLIVPPQIDFEKFAKLAGYKNAASARVVYGSKRRSLGVGMGRDKNEESVDGTKATKTSKASSSSGNGVPKKRGRKPKVQLKKGEVEHTKEGGLA